MYESLYSTQALYGSLKEIDVPRYKMKSSGENVILRKIVHVVSGYPLQFMLYRGKYGSVCMDLKY